ncbi:MAG: PH domain-containing protein [Rikenellaceae bacterium]
MKKNPSIKAITRSRKIIENARKLEKKRETKYNEGRMIRQVFDENNQLLYTKYKFARSGFCKFVTTIIMLIVVGLFIYFLLSSSGSYISAWYLSLAVSILLIFIISFPLNIKLDNREVEIHGVLEVTTIPLANIKRVYRLESYRMMWIIPLCGSYGFGGFFGYYFDIKNLRLVSLCATKLSNMFVIEDIFNEKYILSAPNATNLIAAIRNGISNH